MDVSDTAQVEVQVRRLMARIRRRQIAIVVLVLYGLFCTVVMLGWSDAGRFVRYRITWGARSIFAGAERKEKLQEIWESLSQFRTATGRWPTSEADWRSHERRLSSLLEVPYGDGTPYIVYYHRLGMGPGKLVVRDPGYVAPNYRWGEMFGIGPCEPGALPASDDDVSGDGFPVGLFADGKVGEYSLAGLCGCATRRNGE